jgi:tryptophan-rich hypothetical protein
MRLIEQQIGAAGRRRGKQLPQPGARGLANSGNLPRMNAVDPKKLLLSKWTAVRQVGKEKHFLVSRVLQPEEPGAALVWVEIEAVYSRASRRIAWRELKDPALWRRGWA